jgi:hypothetical protein
MTNELAKAICECSKLGATVKIINGTIHIIPERLFTKEEIEFVNYMISK